MKEVSLMSALKELLAPKELTSIEVGDLVNEFLANGGKITMCDPGVALNFRSQIDYPHKPVRPKRSIPKPPKRRVGKPVKKQRRKSA